MSLKRGIFNAGPWAIAMWAIIIMAMVKLGWVKYLLYTIGALGFGVIAGTIIFILYEWKSNHVHPQTKHDDDCPVVGGSPVDVDHWSCQCDD